MRSHGGTTLLLFVFFQALYALTSSGNTFRVPDEFEVYFQVEHLVDAGDLSVPQTLTIHSASGESIFFGKVGVDRKPYAPYGPLAAVLALPHHLIGRAVAAVAGVPRAPLPDGIVWVLLVGGITMTATATAAALAVAGFHRAVCALGTSPRQALALAMLLGGATVLWPYGTSFYAEAWPAAAFIWAAALLLSARAVDDSRRARILIAAASLLLTVAGLAKATSLIFAPAFIVAALSDRATPLPARLRTALALATGIGLAGAAHLTLNAYRFGNPLDFGYGWAEMVPQLPPRLFLARDVPRGLVVLLLSPGKSVLLWAPPLLLALAHARTSWSRERALTLGVACAAIFGLIFYAAYLYPEGGYAHGPRNLVPLIPLALLLAAGPDAAWWPRPAAIACAAVGVTIAILAVSVSFLEDQGLGGDLKAGARTVYYERITPLQGRVWNRYRLDYVPFVPAMRSGEWLRAATLGEGPDFFPLHLLQARRQLPNGRAIPLWLVWAMPAFWLTILIGAAVALGHSDHPPALTEDHQR
jgi:hypothetical protein